MQLWLSVLLGVGILSLVGCGDNPNITNDEEIVTKRERPYAHMKKFFGEDTLLFSSDSIKKNNAASAGIGVNSYLWQATLETIAFMSLTSVDPFGGVIITEWYIPQNNDAERFKAVVVISGSELRADALKVTVTHQVYKNKGWVNQMSNPKIADDLEKAILTRARQLKINT